MGERISSEQFVFNTKKKIINNNKELLLAELAITLITLESSLKAMVRLLMEMDEKENQHEREQVSKSNF